MNTPSEEPSNEGWIEALRAGDAAALSSLRALLCRRLERVLAGKAGQSDVEDFVQQALAQILEGLDTFRGDSRFTTWASAIAVRVAFADLRRKRWGNVSLDALLQEGAPDPQDAAPVSNRVAHGELMGALQRAIAEALSDKQRTVVLAELQGMPTTVLCEELGVSRGALYKLHHDARKKLRSHLESHGFSVEDFRHALQESV